MIFKIAEFEESKQQKDMDLEILVHEMKQSRDCPRRRIKTNSFLSFLIILPPQF